MKTKIMSAVMAAMMLATASIGSITASAEENSEVSEDTVVEATEMAESTETSETTASSNKESDSSETETIASSFSEENFNMEDFMKIMSEYAENTTVTETSKPDYDGDPYYDTDGNATLIKSEQIIYNTEEMQFIAVTTKDGHVFYVLINYSADNGEDNVYFLNKVDDYDLYALLYAGEEDEDGNAKYTPEQAAAAAEKANGRVNRGDDSETMTDSTETADENDNGEDGETPVKKAPANNSMMLLVGVLALAGVGAAGFFLMKKKKNGGNDAVKNAIDDIDADDDDDFPDYADQFGSNSDDEDE